MTEGNGRSPRLAELVQLFDYDGWANGRVLDAVRGLSAEEFSREVASSFPSIQATLGHMLAAQWIWLERCFGRSPTAAPTDWNRRSLDTLVSEWGRIEVEQQAFVEGLREMDLDRVLSFRTLSGIPYQCPIWQALRHVVNHSTYHRGQIATLLRQLGHQPIGTDLIAFFRETGSGAS
jgi:uncharacterized damage-inducible protein DinB